MSEERLDSIVKEFIHVRKKKETVLSVFIVCSDITGSELKKVGDVYEKFTNNELYNDELSDIVMVYDKKRLKKIINRYNKKRAEIFIHNISILMSESEIEDIKNNMLAEYIINKG